MFGNVSLDVDALDIRLLLKESLELLPLFFTEGSFENYLKNCLIFIHDSVIAQCTKGVKSLSCDVQ